MSLQPNRVPPAPPGAAKSRPVLEVVHAGETFRVAVKRVGTARRLSIRVRSATQDAVLTMPPRASMRTARRFAELHAEWIGTRLRNLPVPISFVAGAVVPVRGVDHVIVHDPTMLRRGRAEIFPSDANVIRVSGDPADTGRHVLALLRREAARDFEAAALRHCGTLGKSFTRISIRDTRSRWGSCSARGALNFSWRLILAPPFVLDYLVAHEVAHLRHMDHSAAFWALTERLAPRTDEAEAWLKRNGPMLHRYAAAPV